MRLCVDKILPIILPLLFISMHGHAQIKRAEKLFQEGRYEEASKALRKDFFSAKRDPGTGYLLAQTYYRLQRYEEARDIMDLIADQTLQSPDMAIFYADVLIANEDFGTAYLNAVSLISEEPSNALAYLLLQKVSDLVRWDTTSNYSQLQAIDGINTMYNEHAPYVSEQGNLWYVTDVNSLQSIFPATYSGQNVNLLYKIRYKEEPLAMSKPQMLVKNRKYYEHDGPLERWPQRELHAISLRDVDAPAYSSQVGIYFIDLNNSGEPTPFRYNEKYNTGHPTFNETGTRMYFASDRPGGFGGMDIWYCDWQDGNWKAPTNMGPTVNSPNNEVFPRYNDGRLYLSSDRTDRGYGGLDLYYAIESRGFKTLYNMRYPINSAYDDFGISLAQHEFGFFTSNRPEGEGGADIYAFSYSPEKIEHSQRMAQLKGPTLPKGTVVTIYNSSKALVNQVLVEEENLFSIGGLFSNESYTIDVGKPDGMYKLEVLDDSGDVADTFLASSDGTYRLRLLDPEDYNMGSSGASDVAIAAFDLGGRLQGEGVDDWTGTEVLIVDLATGASHRVATAADGSFVAEGLPWGREFEISPVGQVPAQAIAIYGSTGAQTQYIPLQSSRTANYSRPLPETQWMIAQEVERDVLGVFLSGTDWSDKDLYLEDMRTGHKERVYPDGDGFVQLGRLSTLKAYRLRCADMPFSLDDELAIMSPEGQVVQRLKVRSEGDILFEYMLPEGPADKQDLLASGKTPPAIETAVEATTDEVYATYRASITASLESEVLRMLLTDDAGRADTVYVRSNGSMVLRDLQKKRAYQLSFIDGPAPEHAMLHIYDSQGKMVVEMPISDKKRFDFTLPDIDDHTLERLNIQDVDADPLALSGAPAPKSENAPKPATSQATTSSSTSAHEAPLPTGEFTLDKLYFGFNSYAIVAESKPILDQLVAGLKAQPTTRVEVRSHTDARGPSIYNQRLSERRAAAVKAYLTSKGIDAYRITAIGVGEVDPVNHCVDGVTCSEAEHALNRRTTVLLSQK